MATFSWRRTNLGVLPLPFVYFIGILTPNQSRMFWGFRASCCMSQWKEKGRLLTPSDFRTLALATLVRREERLTVFKTHKTQTQGRLSTLQVSTSIREHKEPA